MPLLIDTYNVLHVVGVLPPEMAGIDVRGLIELLASSRYRQDQILLVCDGLPGRPGQTGRAGGTGGYGRGAGDATEAGGLPPGPTGIGAIALRYSGPNRSADDVISELIRSNSSPKRLIVVSSDHAVQNAARRRRCRVLTSEAFLSQLAEDRNAGPPQVHTPAKPLTGLTDEMVDRWVSLLGADELNLDELAQTVEAEAAKRESIHDDWYEPDDEDDEADDAAPSPDSAPAPQSDPIPPAVEQWNLPPDPAAATVRPPRSPRSLLPEEMIADAERMLEELVAAAEADQAALEESNRSQGIPALDSSNQASPVATPTAPASPGSLRRPGDVLPGDMISEAQRLMDELVEREAKERASGRGGNARSLLPQRPATDRTPHAKEPPAAPFREVLPEDLIREAESLLEDPGADRGPDQPPAAP